MSQLRALEVLDFDYCHLSGSWCSQSRQAVGTDLFALFPKLASLRRLLLPRDALLFLAHTNAADGNVWPPQLQYLHADGALPRELKTWRLLVASLPTTLDTLCLAGLDLEDDMGSVHM